MLYQFIGPQICDICHGGQVFVRSINKWMPRQAWLQRLWIRVCLLLDWLGKHDILCQASKYKHVFTSGSYKISLCESLDCQRNYSYKIETEKKQLNKNLRTGFLFSKKRARKKITFLFSCVTDVFTFKHLQQRADLWVVVLLWNFKSNVYTWCVCTT